MRTDIIRFLSRFPRDVKIGSCWINLRGTSSNTIADSAKREENLTVVGIVTYLLLCFKRLGLASRILKDASNARMEGVLGMLVLFLLGVESTSSAALVPIATILVKPSLVLFLTKIIRRW